MIQNYCIYTDQISKELNSEHIIPLALGGKNRFEINVDKEFNSQIGSKLDGKLADDFLIIRAREERDARGHSNKPPLQTVKNAKLNTGEPVQAILSSVKPLKIFDVVNKKDIPLSDPRTRTISLQFKIQLDIRLRFTAKVALAAGYYAYGEEFVKHVDHQSFRIIMNDDGPGELSTGNAVVFDKLLAKKGKRPKEIEALIKGCEMIKYSCVLLIPMNGRFGVAVGILGQFIGFIHVPCESARLKNEDSYKFGHCIYLQDNEIIRMPFENLLRILIQRFNIEI